MLISRKPSRIDERVSIRNRIQKSVQNFKDSGALVKNGNVSGIDCNNDRGEYTSRQLWLDDLGVV